MIFGLTWHGNGDSAEAEIRARFRDLADLPHMRPELRAFFATVANPSVTTHEVLAAVTTCLTALRDVERLVTGAERLADGPPAGDRP